jgi:type I restriction enzyme S subunit
MRVPQDWTEHEFEDVFRRLRLKTYQIPTSHYEATGKWPIVDQGKRPIAGYTSRDNPCDQHPFIVFGDHTCEVKFVDFQCFLGADGTQPLATTAVCDLKFGFQILGQIRLPALGYSRHFKELQETVFALPPLPEQRKIADILTTWDEALPQLDALIEAEERRKKALMQQLLTGRRRLKGFSKPWITAKLGTLFKERVEQGRIELPLLSITADRGIVPREDVAKRDSSSEDKSKYLRIAPGDIGYNTMRMWQGVSALSALEGIVSPAYTICTPTDCIDGRFAAHFFKLRHTVHLFNRYSQGLVDDTLNLKFPSFAVIEVTVPSDLKEQRQIAALLDTADQQLTLLRTQRTGLEQQKRGLMQRLLTGKLRVNTFQS